MKKDLIIIGGGPAGLSAGLYAARGKMDVLLIKGEVPVSQAATTEIIENYPGFPDGIGGLELVESFELQARRFGLPIHAGNVVGVRRLGRDFVVETASESYLCRAVIVATGAGPKHLGVKGELEFRGKGVSYCATCDGALFGEATIAVIGGGDAAVEEALFLTRFAEKVYLIHRRDTLRATAVIAERARRNPKIEFIWNAVVTEIFGSEMVEGISVQDVKTGDQRIIPVEGVFVYIGTEANSTLVKGLVEMDERGFIITDHEMVTSLPGIFAAGDVRKKSLRQVVTAVADGAIAVLSAEKYLSS